MENRLCLSLRALASSGFVLPSEQRAALDLSLAIKKKEARLSALSLWGRVLTASGRDYLLARGCNGISRLPEGTLHFDVKHYYSQDGVKWLDLQTPSEETYELCKSIRGCFTGEPSHIYSVAAKVPPLKEGEVSKDSAQLQGVENPELAKEQPSAGGDLQEEVEIRQDDEEDTDKTVDDNDEKKASNLEPASTMVDIGELDRLSALMRQVDYECGVIPRGALIHNAKKELVKNVHFPGVKFLQDLDSYAHLFQKYEDSPLSNDVRGSWSVELLPLEGVVLRSLWWLGYAFYYDDSTKEFGSMYFGFGEKNIDLPFMI